MDKEDKSVTGTKIRRVMMTVVILILLFLLVLLIQATNAPSAVGVVLNALQAILFGILFACIVSPMVKGFEGIFRKCIAKPGKPRKEMIRMLSTFVSMVIFILIIASVLLLIIPQISITLEKILPEFKTMIANFNQLVKGFSKATFWQERVYPMISDFTNNISTWILGNVGVGTEFYQSITSGIAFAMSLVVNILVGFIMAVYMLLSKEKLFAQIRKLNKAIFKEEKGNMVSEVIEEGARIFSGFFGAKILEAALMGLLCFVGMVIFQFPYGTLISVLVGFTNIIPFFGPYLGTIIGAAIIVLVNPWQALGFIILQIVLIQIDGNLLGPKILGHSTGLSAFWVITSILFFTGCFGLVGAFIGVPVFAWIYYIVKRWAEYSLKKQGLPTKTEDFYEKENKET